MRHRRNGLTMNAVKRFFKTTRMFYMLSAGKKFEFLVLSLVYQRWYAE